MTEPRVRRERIVRGVVIKEMTDAKTAHAHRARILVRAPSPSEMTEHLVHRERIVRVVTDAIVMTIATSVMREVQNPPTANHCPVRHNVTARCAMACARWWMDTWCVARNALHRANHSSPKSVTTAVNSKPTLLMAFGCPNI